MGLGKQKRRQWHKENKDFVFEHFNGVCQYCLKPINKLLTKWDVHHIHYHYKNKLYETPAIELIENNIIVLICRPCHDKEHTAVDPENPQHLENKYPCENCGKVERGVFDRKRGANLDKLLCKKCFKELKTRDNNQLSLFE
jgi:5-methylcytosine-specific restriction endonuclease McrA